MTNATHPLLPRPLVLLRWRWRSLARAWALAAVLLLPLGASAQTLLTDAEPWQESEVPPPPAFSSAASVPLDLGLAGPELRFGLVPDSLQLGPDGVIRYVVIAQSRTGAVNVMYEGLRCRTQEMRTYARWSPQQLPLPPNFDSSAGTWRSAGQTRWVNWREHAAARPAWALAHAGLCDGAAPNGNPVQMLLALRASAQAANLR